MSRPRRPYPRLHPRTPPRDQPNAPSLAAFAGRLWVSFTANNNSNALLVASSPDGQTWARNLIV